MKTTDGFAVETATSITVTATGAFWSIEVKPAKHLVLVMGIVARTVTVMVTLQRVTEL